MAATGFGRGFGDRAVRVALAALQGLLLGVLTLVSGIVGFVLTVVSMALIPVGVGVFLLPAVTTVVRTLLNLRRSAGTHWAGVPIAVPYRTLPPDTGYGVIGCWKRCKWILKDPATWRDLAWLLPGSVVGFVLGILPASLLLEGLDGIVLIPLMWEGGWMPEGYGYLADWPIGSAAAAWLCVPQGFLVLLLGLMLTPKVFRLQARYDHMLLAPTRKAQLAARVAQLTATRAQSLDASAAELRRIERDLHDGAQARLVALGMNLGLAEVLFKKDPDAAFALLTEAREASGDALIELRDLVRGIHPPVLAERGLDGAVRAIALALPLPVDVCVEVPRLEAPLESASYFAVAELLTNAVKHSQAAHVSVKMTMVGGTLRMVVSDDGRGGAAIGAGSGLTGVQRRLAAFDGTLSVTSPRGGPTVITMELPCASSSPKTSPSSETV
jgi:signal transduction histidine kinase